MSDTLRVSNLHFGNAASNYNQPQMGYTSVGIGSTANYGFLQFFGTSNTLCWTANGTVGIGTTAPLVKLQCNETPVNGDVTRKDMFRGVRDGTVTVQNAVSMAFALGASTIGISPYGCLDIKVNGLPTLSNNFGAIPDVTVMSVIGNGMVGIGTTDPRNVLDVNGNVSIGARLLGSLDFAPTGNFWIGLNGTATEAERLAIGIVGNATTGVVSAIELAANTNMIGTFIKKGTTSGYDTRIAGGTATNSGYVDFVTNGISRGYIGNASTVDLDLVAQNGAKLNFYTAGTNRMTIATDGNVGIGTVTPTAGLHIKNPTSAMRITGNLTNSSVRPAVTTTPGACEIRGASSADGADDGFLRLSAGGGSSVGSQTYIDLSGYSTVGDMSTNIIFGVLGSERMRIAGTGNVGIGTATINYPLQIGTAGSIIRIGGLTNIGSAADTTTYGLERSRNQIQFSGYRDALTDKVGAKIVAINKQTYGGTTLRQLIQSTDLAFFTVPPDTPDLDNTVERLRITDTGNVGIGTNDPIYRLQIEQGFGNNSNGLFISNTNYGSMQGLNISMVNAGSSYFSSYAALQGFRSGVAAGSTPICLQPSSGNVGIGMINPGYKLDVAGNVNIGENDATYGSRLFFTGTNACIQGGPSGSDKIHIVAGNGTKAVSVAYDGNVGIGTNAPGSTFEVYTNGGIGGTTQMNITSFAGAGTITNTSVLNLRIQGAGQGMVDNIISAQYNSSGVGTYSLAFKPLGTTAMTIVGTGNVGIGVTNPVGSLHINGITSSGLWGNTCLVITNSISGAAGTASGTSVQLHNAFNSDYFNIMSYGYTGGAAIYITSDSLIGVTFARGQNAWSAYSDSRMKINKIPLSSELSNILKLNPVSYLYDTDPSENVNIVTRVGFLADEVFDIYPNLVTKDSGMPYTNQEGETFIPMTMCMTNLIPYHTKAIQELSYKNDTLEAKNAELTQKLDSLLAWAQTQGFSS